MPPKNIGTNDRLVRLCIAVILLIIAIWTLSWIFALAALFVFFEALFSWCFYYQLIGKNTCPLDKK